MPEIAKGEGNTFWVIPSEVTSALQAVTVAFGGRVEEAGRHAEPQPGAATADTAQALDDVRGEHTPPFELAPGIKRRNA